MNKEYVDGFVLPVPKDKLPIYRKIAKKAAAIWREHGAIDYRECVGDDMEAKDMVSFPKGAKAKPDEVIVFAWIVYKSKADRNRINKLVMSDPRIAALCGPEDAPFDCKRMFYGGFKTIVI